MKHNQAQNPKLRLVLVAAAMTVLLAACSEKPQTAGTTHSSADDKPWNGGKKAFDAPGWTPGDKASWEAQIKQRNRSQNEYVRMAP
ncbi:hypothetical protein [Ottowia thiooxydans]|uniref:hypothetical protein n=1 Tax=Ottowia thiooxydans TaxID=219182 RepID=UPI0003FE6528|nr:hypothetical protein [Ottowia thiooxydans]